jgi:hypothetical protein
MSIRTGVFALILALLGFLGFTSAIAMRWERFSPDRYVPGLGREYPGMRTAVRWSTFAQGRIWIVTETGDLWSFQEDSPEATRHVLNNPAYALCATGGGVLVVTGEAQAPKRYTLRRVSEATPHVEVAARGEGVVGLTCDPHRAMLVTTRRMIEIAGDRVVRQSTLSHRLPSQARSQLAATEAEILVGFDVGEWGGGLYRISRRTGAVTEVHHNPSGELCDGLLNGACDPVSAVALLPGAPDCVQAAANEVYSRSFGRILAVCGGRLRQRYRLDCEAGMCAIGGMGLATAGADTWVVGGEQLVRLDAAGDPHLTPFPRLRSYGPFRASFDVHGIVLLLEEADRGPGSISPLLVSRVPDAA